MSQPGNIVSSYNREEDMCQNCKFPTEIVEDFAAGDLICTNCGLVLSERLVDLSSRWRTFSNDNAPTKDKSRAGPAEDMFGSSGLGLSTSIVGAGDRDGSSALARLQNKSTMQADDRQLMDAQRVLNQFGERMQVPDVVVKMAKDLFHRVFIEKKIKGRPLESVCAACLYISCKDRRVPRTYNEVVKLTHQPKKEVAKCYKIISEYCRATAGANNYQTEGAQPVEASQYLSRFSSQLNLDMRTQNLAEHVAKAVKDLGIAGGRGPTTIAAAALFFASQLADPSMRRSFKEVGEVASVSDTTIKQAYKVLYGARESLVTDRSLLGGRSLDELPPN